MSNESVPVAPLPETSSEPNHDTVTELVFGARRYVIVGTAHISQESVADVLRVIQDVKPEKVCIELDQARYAAMTQAESWKNLDIFKVIKEGKGFLLLANLILSSFQKRMGLDTGVKPGEEMRAAIRLCQETNIPFSLIDRDIQVTLRRAWSTSSLWGKNKLLMALLSSAFSSEKLEASQIEELKHKSVLNGMMEELSTYLPSVKHVLIDERDQYLACQMFEQTENVIVAVVGAGHVAGMVTWLNDLHAGKKVADLKEISVVPRPSPIGKILAWAIPAVLLGLIAWAFAHAGWQGGLESLFKWWLIHGSLVALGTIVALGHPLTIILGFIISPLGTLHVLGSVPLITGTIEAMVRKPRVSDLESLQTDIGTIRGFYRNRVTRILLVFVLSGIGGVIGNIISIPALFPKG